MLRKIFAVALFALVPACGSVFAADAQEEAMAAALAAMADQPALTQADIDAYIKLAPQAAAAGADQAAVMKAYEESGLSPERLGTIATKITLGMAMAQGATREQLGAGGQTPDVMFPNDAEAALIAENLPAIMQAMTGAAAQ